MTEKIRKEKVKQYNKEIMEILDKSDLYRDEIISICSSSLMSVAMREKMPVEVMKSLLSHLLNIYEENLNNPDWTG